MTVNRDFYMNKSSEECLQIYEENISTCVKLSWEDEKVLNAQIVKGDEAVSQLRQNPTVFKRKQLKDQVNKGQIAREKLISSHLHYVVAFAKTFKAKLESVEMTDLIQAGNMGLVKAAQKYDPIKATKCGARFITYAHKWINKYVIEEYKSSKRLVHVPDKKMRLVSVRNKFQSTLYTYFDRQPTKEELIAAIAKVNHIKYSEAEYVLKEINLIDVEVVSLNKEIYRDSKITLGETIPDQNYIEDTIDDILDSEDLSKLLGSSLSELTDRERKLLEIRFGIGTGIAWTLESISKEWGLSTERIRIMEARALRKLRHPSRSRKLKIYLE